MRLTAARVTVAALVAAAVTGCSGGGSVAPRDDGPSPYNGTAAELEAELRALAKDLRPASPGAVAAQERVVEACRRLDRMRDTFQKDIPSRERAGLSDGEFILLYGAANNCPSDSEDARVAIEQILTHRARRSGVPTPS